MTQDQIQQQKEFDIRFIEKTFPVKGKISAQMNIVITNAKGENELTAVGGVDSGSKEMFYNICAPLMLEQASKKGKIGCVSIIFEAYLRRPDIVNGKPDLHNYKSKPAKDVVVLVFMTPEKADMVVWEVQPDKTLKREVDEGQAEALEGMMPNVLKTFLDKKAKQN